MKVARPPMSRSPSSPLAITLYCFNVGVVLMLMLLQIGQQCGPFTAILPYGRPGVHNAAVTYIQAETYLAPRRAGRCGASDTLISDDSWIGVLDACYPPAADTLLGSNGDGRFTVSVKPDCLPSSVQFAHHMQLRQSARLVGRKETYCGRWAQVSRWSPPGAGSRPATRSPHAGHSTYCMTPP